MTVSLARARELFDLVNATVCCPGDPTAPCIPFLYPDDGCWARAHEMCRLMEAEGADPAKVWIYGNLVVETSNNPQCKVRWGWHVAPTLQLDAPGRSRTYVIDPSLFQEPVPQEVWAGVQGDPSATLVATPASVYYRDQSGEIVTDPTYWQTQFVLNIYRNALMLRAVGSDGPPPYPTCMAVKQPGTQWLGTIAPRASSRWYTWGWPASLHVVWTIVPLTPCPGGPQLSWKVQVERANTTACTYWITVNNLTDETVRFEGRFDILDS